MLAAGWQAGRQHARTHAAGGIDGEGGRPEGASGRAGSAWANEKQVEQQRSLDTAPAKNKNTGGGALASLGVVTWRLPIAACPTAAARRAAADVT